MNNIYIFKATVFKIILGLLLGTGTITQAGNVTSFELNGTSQSIYMNSSDGFNVTTAWTFEAWINVDNVTGWDDFMFRDGIFSFQVKNPLGDGDFALDFYNRDNAEQLTTDDSQDLNFNTWYHVAATFDGTTATLLVNGVEVDSDAIPANWSLLTNANHLNIGARYTGIYGSYYDGEIDEIRISNIARNIADMQTNYGREEYVSDANTLLLMHFNDGSSPPTVISGTGYSGTVTNHNTSTSNYVFTTLAAVDLLRPNYQTKESGNWDAASTWQYYNETNSNYEDASLSPDFYDNEIAIKDGHTVNVIEDVEVNQVTVEDGATVNITSTKQMTLHSHSSNGMTVNGDVTVDGTLTIESGSPFTITSIDASQGSLINNGLVTGEANVQCYTTAGQWHGMSAPVDNQTANTFFLNNNPIVWMKSYNEADKTFDWVTDLGSDLGDMIGWMVFIDESTDKTYNFNGEVRTGNIGSANDLIRTSDTTGYNFVGNPFTSTIDWDAPLGWTKSSNVEDATYVYNNGNWDTYINGAGTNDGSQYIAMNQGFFVRISDGSSYPQNGTLQMTSDVCVHDDVSFKSPNGEQRIIRLQIADGNLTDETVIRITNEATQAWDGNLDAHKLFSFNDTYPQIYSTENGFMSINSIPTTVESIPLDVVGVSGNQMTISATEFGDFNELLLYDEYLDEITDLTKEDYNFTYSNSISNRFFLSFLSTNIKEEISITQKNFYAYGLNKEIKIVIKNSEFNTISIYNLLGQEIIKQSIHSTEASFAFNKSGYYIVMVSDGKNTESQKVIIK